MAAESRNQSGHDPAESLIDDLIHDILSSAGKPPKGAAPGSVRALIETALATPSQTSALERMLVAQTVAATLADALAPAIAEALTPEIMKALEHYPAGKHAKQGERAAARKT